MFTYAFIVNSAGMTPESYHWEYENDGMKFKFLATSGMDMTKKAAVKLADEGIEYIDLCGDFDEKQAREIADATGGRIEVEYAKYFEDELKRVENLKKADEYGIIIKAEGMKEGTTKLEKIIGAEFNTTIVLIDDEKDAEATAQALVDKGINFIELCSYFNELRCTEIINAIKSRVPVGYCG